MLALIREGLHAARNPRIALAYGGGFISRADLSLITLFLALWAAQSAQQEGLSAAQAAGRVGITIGVTQLTAMVWAPFYGWLADHMNRTVHFAGAFALALVGYGWVGMQDDIVATSALPALIMLGVGQSSTILAATILLGQEAPRESRGSVFGRHTRDIMGRRATVRPRRAIGAVYAGGCRQCRGRTVGRMGVPAEQAATEGGVCMSSAHWSVDRS
jgi:hypothetical protein